MSLGREVRARVSFDRDSGSLVISFGKPEGKVTTLESDALVLLDISGGRLVGIEILLDDRKAIDSIPDLD